MDEARLGGLVTVFGTGDLCVLRMSASSADFTAAPTGLTKGASLVVASPLPARRLPVSSGQANSSTTTIEHRARAIKTAGRGDVFMGLRIDWCV